MAKQATGKGRRTPPASAPPIDERVRRSKERVLKVTAELLTETGLGGVSVDAVARRSGVAKTTIYRHWPTRSDLLMEACAGLGTEQVTPATGSFARDVEALLRNLAALLKSARWATVLPSVIDAAERDPDIARVHGELQKGHSRPFLEVIERAKRTGELTAGADAPALVAALVGPLFYRRWFSREALDEEFVRDLVRRVLGPARPAVNGPPRGTRAGRGDRGRSS